MAAVLGFAPWALAAQDGTAEAEKLIRHGVELRRIHDDDAAQREFQKAYDLVHTPRAAGQLGLAEQALGRWEDAERHVSEAIHAPADPWVVKNRPALDQALNTIQAHLGRIEVIGDQNGAMVSVNAREVGRLPLAEPVRVSAGQVDIQVSAPGYVPVQRTVTIVGGQYQKVVVHLAKEAPAPVPQPQATAGAEPDDAGAAGGDARAPARDRVVQRAPGVEVDGRRPRRGQPYHGHRLHGPARPGGLEAHNRRLLQQRRSRCRQSRQPRPRRVLPIVHLADDQRARSWATSPPGPSRPRGWSCSSPSPRPAPPAPSTHRGVRFACRSLPGSAFLARFDSDF